MKDNRNEVGDIMTVMQKKAIEPPQKNYRQNTGKSGLNKLTAEENAAFSDYSRVHMNV